MARNKLLIISIISTNLTGSYLECYVFMQRDILRWRHIKKFIIHLYTYILYKSF